MIRYPTLPFVPTAIALGHLLGYAIAHPDPGERAHALVGHGHLWVVVTVGALSGLCGLAALARARSLDRRLVPRYGRLAQLGAGGLWIVELAERMAQGRLETFAAAPSLWCGLVLQTVVAAALIALARTASSLGVRFLFPRRSARVLPRREISWCPWRQSGGPGATQTPPNRRRGPPLLAA